MKVLVVHDYGPLGRVLLEQLKKTSLVISPLLISEPGSADMTALADWIPEETDLIVNALWLSDPAKAEANPEAARQTVFSIPMALAEHAREHDIALMQLSSSYVFDGRKQSAYLASNPGHPFSQLGNWQWECEQALRTLLPRHLILRTGWSLGRYIQLIQACQGRGGTVLPLSSRYRGQPVASRDLARVMIAVLQQLDCGAELWGTYQYTGAEEISQYELGQALTEMMGADDGVKVLDEAPGWAALEPENATLGCTKIRNTFGIKQLPWRTLMEDELELMRVSRRVEQTAQGE
ncbi:sugar nucleotide-binding protein [Marinobacter zhejiangensis]|uniref:dTDP-4-dehydrorhamnose reductase n=1 Tax=Marinobacter zhejiangensis TaxID=488535 RepID=A0A1I4TG51_9GAMM|nr:sugar nucleotide-binding protein [Marinobacter zhejiangensis]SFM75696.1 dTDP-4-dehydrorhamnose reductase [Marinobacter zhejiangensis]